MVRSTVIVMALSGLLVGCESPAGCEETRVVTAVIEKCLRSSLLGVCEEKTRVPIQQTVCADEPDPAGN